MLVAVYMQSRPLGNFLFCICQEGKALVVASVKAGLHPISDADLKHVRFRGGLATVTPSINSELSHSFCGGFWCVVWGGFVARVFAYHGARSYTRNYADHTRSCRAAAPGGQLCVQGLPGASGLD